MVRNVLRKPLGSMMEPEEATGRYIFASSTFTHRKYFALIVVGGIYIDLLDYLRS